MIHWPTACAFLALELGLAAGYALCWCRQWLHDARRMVGGWCEALKGSAEQRGEA